MTADPTPLPPNHHPESPKWGRATKVIVAVTFLLLTALIVQRFQSLIAQIVAAAIIAYILNPIVVFVNRRTSIARTKVILGIYLLLAVGIGYALATLSVAAFQQINTLIDIAPNLISNVANAIETFVSRTDPFVIGTFVIDPSVIPWDSIANQILGFAEPVLGRSGSFVTQTASATLGWVGTLFFVYIISIYIAIEIPELGGQVSDIASQPGYRYDVERLLREFGRIWNAYLRGQVILGVVIFFIVWLGLSALGVQNALALGILSGLLEFLPFIGPVVGAGSAMIVAFFQPTNYMGLPGWQYALVVLLFMFAIQQLENSFLVPRIVGEALDLHPIVVMISVFMGGSLAGILGAILAAPVAATLKLVGIYAWRKMFDLPPFPDPEPDDPPSSESIFDRSRDWVRERLNQAQTLPKKKPPSRQKPANYVVEEND